MRRVRNIRACHESQTLATQNDGTEKKLVGYASAWHWPVQRPPRQSPEKTEKDDPALAEKQDPRIIDRELTDKADWGTPPPRRSARWLA